MTENNNTPDQGVKLERHVQTILVALITIGIGWNVKATMNNQTEIITMRNQMASIQTQVGSLEGKLDGLYRTSDATRDFALRDQIIGDLRSRLSDVEKQLRDALYTQRKDLTRQQ